MAGANKRTTCALATTAIVFIIVIIILCLVPDPCYRNDPRPECQHPKHAANAGTISTSPKPTTPISSSPTTTSSSTSSTSSTSITTERAAAGDSTTTASSTHISESSLSTDAGSTTTLESDISTMTTELQGDVTTTEMYYEVTSIDTVSTTHELDKTVYETSTSTTSEEVNATEVSTTATSEETIAADVFTTETADEAENKTEVSTTETDETGNQTVISTTETADSEKETEMSTTEIAETEGETEISTTETAETEGKTEMSTTETAETEGETEISTTETAETENETEISDTTTIFTTDVYTKLKYKIISEDICNTPICKEVSRRMLDIMDPNDVDPCEDFYQYSCGGVLDDPFLKPENAQYYADNIIKDALINGDKEDQELEELFVMYDSCINYTSVSKTDRIKLAREVFDELGYQFNPMAIGNYKRDHPTETVTFNLGEALGEMMKRHFAPFFDIIVDVSKDDKSKLSLKMVLPSFESAFTGDRAKYVCLRSFKAKAEEAKQEEMVFDVNLHYEDYVNCTNYGPGLQARMNHIKESVNDFGILDSIENSSISEQIDSQTRQILEGMLTEFAKVTPDKAKIRKEIIGKNYEEVALSAIDDETVFGELPFKMQDLIETLLGHQISNPQDLKIQVYFKDVFTKLFEIISFEDKPVMQNIVLLMWMEHIYNDLIGPLGPPPGSPDYCFSAVTRHMDDYVSLLYLKKLSELSEHMLEDQMKHMIDLTLDLAIAQVKTSGLNSRNDFLQKLESMTGEIASVEGSRKSLQWNKNNIMINIAANNFTGNYMNLMQTYRKRLYSILEHPTNDERKLWSLMNLPYKTSGVASHGLNKFLIPHGAMSPPYFYNGAPAYINYAGIGHMIAHELLHSFDSTGVLFNGVKKSAMEKDRTLIQASECQATKLADKFSMNSSTDFHYSFQLERGFNLNEQLVDSPAINLAWDVYVEGLRNQRAKSLTTTAIPPKPRITEILSGGVETTTNLYDLALIHWEDKRILQTYFIKLAQNHCSSTSELDILRVMEDEHLPPKLRVNLGLQYNKLFKEAFNCPIKPEDENCFYNPTGRN